MQSRDTERGASLPCRLHDTQTNKTTSTGSLSTTPRVALASLSTATTGLYRPDANMRDSSSASPGWLAFATPTFQERRAAPTDSVCSVNACDGLQPFHLQRSNPLLPAAAGRSSSAFSPTTRRTQHGWTHASCDIDHEDDDNVTLQQGKISQRFIRRFFRLLCQHSILFCHHGCTFIPTAQIWPTPFATVDRRAKVKRKLVNLQLGNFRQLNLAVVDTRSSSPHDGTYRTGSDRTEKFKRMDQRWQRKDEQVSW